MILEYKPHLLVSEGGERLFIKLERIVAVEGDGSGSGSIERADYVQKRAFAAARRTHYRGGFSAREF